MSLGPLYYLKELPQTFQPLLLCEFIFPDGTVYRASTHPLSVKYGGTAGKQFDGHDWEPRVKDQQIGASQAMSDIGVDIPPSASVTLADPDRTLQKTFELAKGFKGATLKLYSIMWDVGNTLTPSFSGDGLSIIKFIGTCNAPSWNQGQITINAKSLLNVSQTMMPPIKFQMLCPWTFPQTLVDRQTGLTDSSSVFYQCGYSPDLFGGVGNFDSGTACFTFCNYTRDNCLDRLGDSLVQIKQLDKDQSGRDTGRFGGFTWAPQSSNGIQESYTNNNWSEIVNASTSSKYGDFVPLTYGTTWVQPEVVGVSGDGNYSRFQVLVTYGQITTIKKVIVNGYEIKKYPGVFAHDINSDEYAPGFQNGSWFPIQNGSRNGLTDTLPGWGGQGDPYGSYAVINVQVLRTVAEANTIPDVQVLVDGIAVRVYSDSSNYFTQFSRNPAWILMDVLTWCGWKYQDFDLPSWIRCAAVCDENIYYNSMVGVFQNYYNEAGFPPYPRYSVGFSLKTQVAIGNVIRGLRNAMRASLYFDQYSGKMTIVSKQSLASQQPNLILGSNITTPIDSTKVDGTPGIGYFAYHFDRTNIMKDQGGRSTLEVYQLENADAPNKISNKFQNRENSYSQDSATIIDTEDASRMGGYPIAGTFPVLGVQTYDHMRRVVMGYFAECYRGNMRLDYLGSAIGDTGGTMFFRFFTTIKGVHLTVGQLCCLTDDQSGGQISMVPVRIIRIAPQKNFETVQVTAMYHNDNWYMDTYGQVNEPTYGNSMVISNRPPFAWEAGILRPSPDDVYYPYDTFFAVLPYYQVVVGDQMSAFLDVSGVPTVNVFGTAMFRPRIANVGTGLATAAPDAWPAGQYYVGLAEYSQTNNTGAIAASPLSLPCAVRLTSPGYLQVPVLQFGGSGAVGVLAAVGYDPLNMFWALNNPNSMIPGTAPSGSMTIKSFLNDYHTTPPDEVFTKFRITIQRELWPGVASATITSISAGASTALSVELPPGTSASGWGGREASFVGFSPQNLETNPSAYVGTSIPVANLAISSADGSGNMTVTGNPNSTGTPQIAIGDMVIIRFKPNFGTDSVGPYFEDAGAISPQFPTGFPVNGLIGAEVFIIAGTGKGSSTTILSNTATRCYVRGWPDPPDSTTRLVILSSSVEVEQTTAPVTNSILNFKDVAPMPSFRLEVTPLQHKMLMIQVYTEGANGMESQRSLSPFREVYVFDGSIDGVLVNGVGGPGNFG